MTSDEDTLNIQGSSCCISGGFGGMSGLASMLSVLNGGMGMNGMSGPGMMSMFSNPFTAAAMSGLRMHPSQNTGSRSAAFHSAGFGGNMPGIFPWNYFPFSSMSCFAILSACYFLSKFCLRKKTSKFFIWL